MSAIMHVTWMSAKLKSVHASATKMRTRVNRKFEHGESAVFTNQSRSGASKNTRASIITSRTRVQLGRKLSANP